MATESQNQKILNHLKTGAGITQEDARTLFGCWRLASRINDLRRMGHWITTTSVESTNRDGKKVQFAKYFLITATDNPQPYSYKRKKKDDQ